MPNMKSLSLTVQKLWSSLKYFKVILVVALFSDVEIEPLHNDMVASPKNVYQVITIYLFFNSKFTHFRNANTMYNSHIYLSCSSFMTTLSTI